MDRRLLAPDPARIDAEWMTVALRRAGLLGDGGRVSAVAAKGVGNGLVGDSFRFTLSYEGDAEGAPASVVGKFPARDPASRKSGTDHMLYIREVSFYRELARTVAIHVPRALVAEIDPATDDFTLIFEDLGPARQGDQLTGCSLEDAKVAMAQAAALHAPRWGDTSLLQIDWLAVRPQQLSGMVDSQLPAIIGLFAERYDGVLEPEFMDLVRRLPATLAAQRGSGTAPPLTVQHADYRLDNVMFDVQDGRHPMATLDWQTVTVGAGATDVAYFLSAGIDPALRREHERELVGFYHAELVRRGVTGYDRETCWTDYRRFAVHGILMGVFSALSVERTERGDALFLKMTRGACEQALDLDTFKFWGT
jgi:hypothetical protein